MTRPIAKFLVAAIILAPIVAAADDETADGAYKRGQTALKAGRIHEACDAFAASIKLAPRMDNQLSLADCLEQDGKIMAASRLYRSLAEKDTDATRAKKSAAKAAKLESKAPRLRFLLSQKPEGVVLDVDGETITGTDEFRVDIGPHEVIATAPGFEGHASPKVDGSRPIIDVIIRMEPKAEAPPPPPPQTAPATETPAAPPALESEPAASVPAAPVTERSTSASNRKRNGVILTAAGAGLAIGAGVMFGISASKFSTESELCPNARCGNEMDLARAHALLDNGTTIRSVGIGVGIGGVALLAVGSYLLLTPDHETAPSISLSVGSGTTAIGFGGSF